ncbi:uncharacterized protein LOC132544409 [Ylistrum balloti]|uniref:uncharacterized protein LOC132544409 n=1 Tax=Ylistrum balloti TaxID=509963 RepID=UPI002905CFA3|nr:uncharacterized protein LOC132544409 [Ylistrum balloti]
MNLQVLKNPSGRALHTYLKHHFRPLYTSNIDKAVHVCCKSGPDSLVCHSVKKSAVLSSICGCSDNLKGQHYSTTNGMGPHSEPDEVDPILKTATISDTKLSNFTEIVPGKGPPPEPPVDCCMSGCANCVWITYAEELKNYYCDGKERALHEIEQIDNPSLKAFIKLELSLL